MAEINFVGGKPLVVCVMEFVEISIEKKQDVSWDKIKVRDISN